MKSRSLVENGAKVVLIAALFVANNAAGQVVIVDMDFDGITGLENSGAGPAGVLKGGASISSTAGVGGSGALVLDGSNEPEPTGSGLDLPIGDFGVFTGLGDFTVSFDFATIGGDSGALFSADGAMFLDEQGIEFPGDQAGGVNIGIEGDFGVFADLWFIGALDFEGTFNDDQFHNLVLSYDAGAAELSLSVDGGDPSILEVDEGEGFERDTSNDLTRLGDENNPDFGFEFNDGCNCKFDNLLITGPTPPPVKLTVDRTTGDLALEILATDPTTVTSLTIESEAGTLVAGNYTGVGATGGGFADWTIDSADEFEISESGTAATVDSGDGPFSLGDAVWQPFFDEDLSVSVFDTGLDAEVGGVVEFVGGAPLLFGDLNLDNVVDELDYLEFQAGFGSDVEGLPFFDAYFLADLNGDELHNFEDWILFIEAFEEFNGAGSFAALVNAVPEPTSLLLALAVLIGVFAARRRAVLVLLFGLALALGSADRSHADLLVEYLFDTDFSDTSGNNRDGMPNPGGFSSPSASGGKLQLSGDIDEGLIVPLGAANPFGGLSDYTIEMSISSTGGFNDAGVVALSSANLAEPDSGDNQSFAVFIEPQEEVEPGVFEGGALVVDYFFVGEVRVPDALLLDGAEHSVKVTYQAPEMPNDPEGEPNPGLVFLNIDGQWLATGELAPRPAATHDHVRIGSTPNLEFPYECEEGECFTAELDGTVDNFRIFDEAMAPSLLRAEVDVTSGDVTMLGGEFAREIRYYEINSEGNSLVPEQLNGLSDKNIDPVGEGTGETWDVLNASENQIAEAFLLGSTLFSDVSNSSISLGNIFTPGSADRSLEFIAVTAENEDIGVEVSYVNIPMGVVGDFNGDGVVNAADYTEWRNNLGTDNALLNDEGLGVPITQAHYDLWKNAFGNMAGGSGAGASVPEPSCAVLLMLVSVLGAISKGRRGQRVHSRASGQL